MRGLLAKDPALHYLDLVLHARIAAARSAAEGEGEERQLGASAVEWVVITMIVLVLISIAAIIITKDIKAKSTSIGNCITDAGNGNACTP
jgi:hypothetical protein